MCYQYKPKGVRKTGDITINDVAVAKNLTDKEYVKFINDATEEASKKGMTLEKYLDELVDLVKKNKLRNKRLVKLYRVQGGKVPNASRHRFVLKNNKLKFDGDSRLYVTFKNENRVLEYWVKRGDSEELFTADVSEEFFNKNIKDTVKQSRGKEFPLKPQYGDASKTDFSIGLPKKYFDELLENMVNIEILKFE